MYMLNAGMGIGLSGLQAAQNGISVTGQNITNINTPGYARQRVNLETNYAVQIDKLQFGLGVNTRSVQAIRDRFLDMQLTLTITRQFGTKTRYEALENVSSVFIDEDEFGMRAELQRFFESFEELAARPENDAVRMNVVTRAQTLITGLKSRYQVLEDKRTEINRSIASMATEINTLASQIAKLNQQIASEVPKGSDNNSRDQRAALVNRLAELIGIQVYEDTQERLTITAENGMPLVSGGSAIPLILTDVNSDGHFKVELGIGKPTGGVPSGTEYRPDEKVDVTTAIKSGTLGGLLDLRDNILPDYLMHMDQLAASIIIQVNQIHRDGAGLDNPYAAGGLDFFLGPEGNDPWGQPMDNLGNSLDASVKYKGVIHYIAINQAIIDDPRKIASGDPTSNPGPGNNEIARQLAALQNAENTVDSRNVGFGIDPITGRVTVGNSGPFGVFISTTANKIGNQTLKYRADATTDEDIRIAIEIQRDRLSAVDMDEEATNLIVFQRSYQACSRFIGVIDQLTEQLINNFGR
ncbi:MAG: flagellar hook-associated protein FlgK [Holophagales bacterium]|jgi:flagellar hook-associated protein 1 FlgK|nr:flagellar hook-associated protein FlgK [Holophagales bacterium]